MGHYNCKLIDYGYKEKVLIYSGAIETGKNTSASKREQYVDMSDKKKAHSDKERLRYYKHKVRELKEVCMMNTCLSTAITLTFKDSVTNYDIAVARFGLFIQRLKYAMDKPLKYIATLEYQTERSKKEGIEKGGVFHFHMLCNVPFIEHEFFTKRIWTYGYTWIDYLGNDYQRRKAIGYTLKYICKNIVENSQEQSKRHRWVFTSRNLKKPTVTLISDRLNKGDVILEHLDNMLKDGSYDIKSADGKIINHAEYIEYKKN